jgi:hypothetical protein
VSWTINTPVKGFSGEVAGVMFKDGEGVSDTDPAYFRRHGYTVQVTATSSEEEAGTDEQEASDDTESMEDTGPGKSSGGKTAPKAGK